MAAAHSYTLESHLQAHPTFSQDTKITALFSSFPPKRSPLNAPSWDAKLRFWRDIIFETTRLGLLSDASLVSFDSTNLEQKFVRRGLTPLGLDVVLDDLQKSGDIIPLKSFTANSSEGWSLFSVVTTPISWGWSAIMGGNEPSSHKTRQAFVVVPLVKELASGLLTSLRSSALVATDNLYSYEELEHHFEQLANAKTGRQPSSLDLSLVQTQLERDGDMIFDGTGDKRVVKIRSAKTTGPLMPVSVTDRGVVTMKRTVTMLQRQIASLEAQISSLVVQAQQKLRQKQKPQALYCLRQKARLTAVVEKRLSSLENIDAILQRIAHAQTEAEVLAAYQLGSSALQEVLKVNQLTPENVEKTMDDLHDAFADQKEVDDAMALGQSMLNTESDADAEELEKELNMLLAEETAAKVQALPSVPVATPPVPSTVADLDVELDNLLVEDGREKRQAKTANKTPLPA
ncbi:Snf7-domain-containing protein [Gaertneriomyces semiglobifer]|nr:Snf7-domain-containing protein [Gaertneriomyces semiglobifer]